MRNSSVVLRFGLALALTALGGCGGSKGRRPADAARDVPVFVNIDLTAEEMQMAELDNVELGKVSDDCGSLLDLEPAARLGRLSEMQVRCLNDALGVAERQTTKDKISRVLLSDAFAKGDIHRWMGVAARHLEEVERADPEIVYLFAYNLVQIGNPERMQEAIHWADIALENKSHWEGEPHVRRVYALYKIRTMAAFKSWEYLEGRYRDAPSESLKIEVEKVRNEMKTYAREWLEYARSSGRDRTEPMRMCSMAAGTDDFCNQGG
jgi:hypothetical protein